MRPTPLVLLTALISLGACDTTPQHSISDDFGSSIRHNMAAQIVNPPVADAEQTHDGRRANDAWDRYRSGKVTPPQSLSTSDTLLPPLPN